MGDLCASKRIRGNGRIPTLSYWTRVLDFWPGFHSGDSGVSFKGVGQMAFSALATLWTAQASLLLFAIHVLGL
jgi:hypothetical protein